MSLERDKLWIKRIEVNTLAGRGCDAARSTTKTIVVLWAKLIKLHFILFIYDIISKRR